jgi:hypothetical protein
VRPWRDKGLKGDWYLELPPEPRSQPQNDD